jgi:DNA repair exonuclease SbcCD nuclease subunit
MPKALLFSDLHIHAHKDRVDRLQNCIDVLDWVFKEAKKNNCEYIFFLGDLFHERAKIDVKNYLKTFEVFMEHLIEDESDINMYLLVGNHDMYHKDRWDINSIKPLSAIPRVHIVENPKQILFGKTKVDWLPHTENPVKELEKLKEENGGAGDILLGHLSVHGALLNLSFGTKSDVVVEHDNDMIFVDKSVFKDWKMTFLGHYHGAQHISEKIEYVGSPLQLTFGESFQEKHIIVLDLNTLEKKYIKNEFSPKHLLVTPQDIKDENYQLNGNFVRITVENSMSHKEVIDLKKEIAQTYNVLTLDTKPKEKKIEEDKIMIENVQSILLNIEDMLQKYISEIGTSEGLDVDKLILTGRKCLENNTNE